MINNRKLKIMSVFVIICGLMALPAMGQSFTAGEVQEAFQTFRGYDYGGDPEVKNTLNAVLRDIGNQPQLRRAVEEQMIALLESDATLRAKQFVCHQLWIVGTDRSIPVLAKMLREQDTAEMACYALRTHPGADVDDVLRAALKDVDDVTKVRIVNLLGDRKDEESVKMLIGLLYSDKADLAEAAAISLGAIGAEKGINAIKTARSSASGQMRFVLTRAWLRGAESYARDGRVEDALMIYKTLFDGKESLLTRRSALVDALQTLGDPAAELMEQALADSAAMLRAAAIANSPMLQGQDVTRKLIAVLQGADAETQALLIEALAQRDDPPVRDAVNAMTDSDDGGVRRAAYAALGGVGDGSSAVRLCSGLADVKTPEEADTILASLRRMQGVGVDEAIVDQVGKAEAGVKEQLIGVIRDRGYRPAVAELLANSRDNNAAVARAALKAVGSLGGAENIPALLDILQASSDKSVQREAVRAVVAVAGKTGANVAAAGTIAQRLEQAGTIEDRISLLQILAAIPSDVSLAKLQAAVSDGDVQISDAAVRALARYKDDSAIDSLREIFQTTQNQVHRAIALRGGVRLCKTTDIPASNALRFCEQALNGASGPAEKKLILSGLAEIADPGAIDLVLSLVDDPVVKSEACLALLSIAEKTAQSNPAKAAAAARKILAEPTATNLHDRAKKLQK